MKITYLGSADPKSGEDMETTVFGKTFTKGEPVDVSDLPKAQQEKLKGNPMFGAEKETKTAPLLDNAPKDIIPALEGKSREELSGLLADEQAGKNRKPVIDAIAGELAKEQ